VATTRLTPPDAARLIGVLAQGLAAAAADGDAITPAAGHA
jgi:hypothetical protein